MSDYLIQINDPISDGFIHLNILPQKSQSPPKISIYITPGFRGCIKSDLATDPHGLNTDNHYNINTDFTILFISRPIKIKSVKICGNPRLIICFHKGS
jgi:hypothetical protein